MRHVPDETNTSISNQIHFFVMKYINAVERMTPKNPVGVARLYFLLGSLVWNSYATLDPTFPFVDGFQVRRLSVSRTATEQEIFLVFMRLMQTCFVALRTHCVPSLEPLDVPPYTPDYPFTTTVFADTVNAYLIERNNDGYFTTQSFSFPNSGKYIICDGETIQDLNTYLTSTTTWAPLETHFSDGTIRRQSPVQPYFSEVRNWLSPTEMDDMYDIAATHYPSESLFDEQVENFVSVMSNLSDREKLIAELWANSTPGRVLPPGSWMVLLSITLAANPAYSLKKCVALVGGIGFCLFHAGITAWGVKYRYMQARPIQILRQRYLGQTISFPITETEGNGGLWLPYQPQILYTPAFPDYVSGHSTFSMSCACFLELATGSDTIPVQGCTVDPSYLQMMAPNFDDMTRPVLLSSLVFPPKCCTVDTSIPIVQNEFSWTSWTGLARQIGMSRIYGNIHWANSNLGGLAIGEWVASKMLSHLNWDSLHID